MAKRIIPCMDVKNGRVVKGVNFVDLADVGDPVALGMKYSNEGADELVFLDISASNEGRSILFDMVANISENVFIPFTVGGGIRSVSDIRNVLKNGADKVSINTSAVKNPDLISRAAEIFGSQCIVVAIDVKKIGDGYKVFINGGREEASLEVLDWAKEVETRGAGEILLTSIDQDGTKTGLDNVLLKKVSNAVNIPVIASGGVGSLDDFKDGFLEGGADAVLAAGIFHRGEYSISDVKKFLNLKIGQKRFVKLIGIKCVGLCLL
ncbi:MAG TPA: imidazole glycerol phosphate synthase subunit HisF [Candidatus Gracilibacteria bacterium]|nr:imidazole glycerol phosphate synthase subunit HisF [Candidatus Gracilibacteria bacterium]